MARKLYYKILRCGQSDIPDRLWEDILRLQHWYNSEFIWTAGRLALKMFAVFPNTERKGSSTEDITALIAARQRELEAGGKSHNEIIRTLHAEGLIIAVPGGYFDDCLASGFTRTAGNEFNAYLVSEFLLKVTRLLPEITLDIVDEGEFIKPHHILLSNGNVVVPADERDRLWYYEAIVKNRHVFSVVDSAKYDNIPRFRVTVPDFGELSPEERMEVLRDRSWLGFENNYDINGDDIQGYDLNKQVGRFSLMDGNLSPGGE
ncbi:MAG TPA: hypothetical protein VLY03_10520 [Bacteroidota bacterium]|nr:hypothetical protein [Bacteroidota bacterium]